MELNMLTTIDNPYNPFNEFDEWRSYDETAGYNTLALLGRVVRTSSELSDSDQSLAIEEAIEEIVKYNVSGVHLKILAPEGYEE